MREVFSIYEIADINKSSITAKDNFSFINYLDTSSLTKNKVDSLQFLESAFPSRAKRKVTINTILYSTVRPNQEHFGIIENQIADNLIASTGFSTIDIVSNKINAKYLYYKLIQPFITNYLQVIAENSVSAYPSIKPEAIGNLRFSFPNLPTQQKIASILSALDDKIELNNKLNDNLEQMAKTLYDYWFVQFDFPDENGSPYKSSGGKMVWIEVLKREIPEGWEVKKLEDLLTEFTKGLTTSYVEKSNLINLNQKVNKGFSLERQYFKYLDESIAIPPNKYASKNDILINSLGQGTLGRIHYFIDNDSNIVIDQHLFILRTNIEKISSSYLYNTLNSNAYQIQIERQITGSTGMQMLNASNLKDLKIIIPTLGTSISFERIVSDFYDNVSHNEKQNQQLSSLRDWLLPMLMNGQVIVE